MPRGKRTRAWMALVACVLWLAGFELLPWLHIATHDHIGAHHHDASGAIIRDNEADDDHDEATDEHAHDAVAHEHDHDAVADEHEHDPVAHEHEHEHDAATDEHADEDAEVDEHGEPVAHRHPDARHADHPHADHPHDAPPDGRQRLRNALGHGRHSLAHHDVSTTAPPPVLTTPLPVERRPTFVLAVTAIEPYSFSPGRAVARGPPTISFES